MNPYFSPYCCPPTVRWDSIPNPSAPFMVRQQSFIYLKASDGIVAFPSYLKEISSKINNLTEFDPESGTEGNPIPIGEFSSNELQSITPYVNALTTASRDIHGGPKGANIQNVFGVSVGGVYGESTDVTEDILQTVTILVHELLLAQSQPLLLQLPNPELELLCRIAEELLIPSLTDLFAAIVALRIKILVDNPTTLKDLLDADWLNRYKEGQLTIDDIALIMKSAGFGDQYLPKTFESVENQLDLLRRGIPTVRTVADIIGNFGLEQVYDSESNSLYIDARYEPLKAVTSLEGVLLVPNIESINLNRNHVRFISQYDLLGSGTLKKINLLVNPIQIILDNTFVNLNNLTDLTLQGSLISDIEADAFRGLKSLTTLDLAANRIRTLLWGVFTHVSNLRILHLNHNQIDHLPSGLFNTVPSLELLDLSYNEITQLESNAFTQLTKLIRLLLHRNKLSQVGATTFSNLPALQNLNLEYNCLSKETIQEITLQITHPIGELKTSYQTNCNAPRTSVKQRQLYCHPFPSTRWMSYWGPGWHC